MKGIVEMDVLFIVLLAVFLIGIRPKKMQTNAILSKTEGTTLRGLFSIIVVFHHIALVTETGLIFPIFKNVGHLAVGVFFFLSGYGVQKSHMVSEKYKHSFLERRLSKILIPYIVVTLFYWMTNTLLGNHYTLKDILVSLVNGVPIARYSWYILSITYFYVMYWVLMCICKKKYNLMIVGACLWYVIYAVVCMYLGYGSSWYKTTYLLIVGMFWAIYENKISYIISKYYIIVVSLTIIVLFTVSIAQRHVDTDSLFIFIFCIMCSTVLFVLSIMLLIMKIKIGNCFLDFLGKISLEIYLIHGLFCTLFRSNCIYINDDSLFAFVVIAGSILAGWILHIVFSILDNLQPRSS